MDLNSNFDSLVGANAIALDLITIFGCALSIVCLTIAFLIFTLFRFVCFYYSDFGFFMSQKLWK